MNPPNISVVFLLKSLFIPYLHAITTSDLPVFNMKKKIKLANLKDFYYFCNTMAVLKTRNILVDVARQLFAKKGLESTTMNDIAIASGKGRRTLYTYFKNKEEIYLAVIIAELDRLSEKMSEVADKHLSPEDKLVEIIYAHLNLIKEAVSRNGNLRAEFFRDIWMVEKVRKNFDQAEIKLFTRVLEEGIASDEFNIDNVSLVAEVMHYCVKGMEVPYIYGRLGDGLNQTNSRPLVRNLVHRALKK